MFRATLWSPSWEQVQNRLEAGKARVVTVSASKFDDLIEASEEDRRFHTVRDAIGDPHLVWVDNPQWALFEVTKETGDE